jgi:hypothetical protein
MDLIARLRERGVLPDDKARLLDEIESGRLVSIHAELRSLLYAGALLIVFGVGGTVKRYALELGPLSIIGALSAAIAFCAIYCARRAAPYSPEKVESPTAAFDYVLYLGCALLGILFGYLELKFKALGELWHYYLLFSGSLFLALAYRCDNRLVLALGIANLGAWLGVKMSMWRVRWEEMRWVAISFGSANAAAGLLLAVKRHFDDVYLNVATHVLCLTFLSRVVSLGPWCLDAPLLAACCGLLVYYALRRRLFQYFLYGTVYAYIGLSACVLRRVHGVDLPSVYFLVTSIALAALLFRFRRTLEERE